MIIAIVMGSFILLFIGYDHHMYIVADRQHSHCQMDLKILLVVTCTAEKMLSAVWEEFGSEIVLLSLSSLNLENLSHIQTICRINFALKTN